MPATAPRNTTHAKSTSCKSILSTALLLAALLTGCATSNLGENTPLRPVQNAPDRFLVGSFGGTSLEEPTPGTGCRNPMVDPRDGTELQLVRSSEELGDYEVSQGRYGVGAGELIRLDCGTGDALGIVSR